MERDRKGRENSSLQTPDALNSRLQALNLNTRAGRDLASLKLFFIQNQTRLVVSIKCGMEQLVSSLRGVPPYFL